VDELLAALIAVAGGLAGGLVGAIRQNAYGNLRLREAIVIGLLSPLGVLVGVVVANEIPQRALELSFAALALFIAAGLVRRALAAPS